MKPRYTLTLALLLLAGCATRYPMGLSKEQWEALPPETQAEYRAEQYRLDEQRREQERIRREEREREERLAAEAERERIRQVYANAQYGDIIRVAIEGGSLLYHGRSYPYHPVSFELARGEEKRVEVATVGSSSRVTSFDVMLSRDGNTFVFDASDPERTVIVNRNWEHGQLQVTPPDRRGPGIGLVGATFYIKLKDLPGAPQRVIIENR